MKLNKTRQKKTLDAMKADRKKRHADGDKFYADLTDKDPMDVALWEREKAMEPTEDDLAREAEREEVRLATWEEGNKK